MMRGVEERWGEWKGCGGKQQDAVDGLLTVRSILRPDGAGGLETTATTSKVESARRDCQHVRRREKSRRVTCADDQDRSDSLPRLTDIF